jgi:3-oxoacyl-[acyl-carrier-protein] synthase-1
MSSVFVMGTGMMTSVGLSAAETAASVRSRMMRFAEIDIRDQNFEPFKFAEIPEDGLPLLAEDVARESGLSMREIRLLRVGTLPLLECLRNGPPDIKPPLLLSLPDIETQRPLNRKRVLELLGRQTGLAFDIARSSAAYSGRAGGVLAIAAAVQLLASGSVPFVIAGGIESFRDLYVLGTLDLHKRVRSATTNDAFIPGEGAAFLLLAASPAALHAGSGPLARVLGCAESFEPGNLYSPQPYLGEGLANGLQNLLQTCGLPAPIEEVYSSMNGESHWAKEWGVAYTRNMAAFNPNHGMHHPADCYGETAAACGLLLAGLAAVGMQQGYRRAPALIYSSSDKGQIGLAALAAA